MVSSAIVFVSLFLGIVTGTQTIEVAVSDEVASVEIRLDGELIGKVRESPWRTTFDFGQELSTHELTAVALGTSGREISRAVQLLNVPRKHVEAEILLEEWVQGSPTIARLIWHSAEASKPLRIAVTLDGTLLPAPDTSRIELPRVDPEAFHFLTAELVFADRETAATEVGFGGGYGTAIQTELTAVPIRVESRKAWTLAATPGWLRHIDGTELAVVAVDDGDAEVAVVREEATLARLAALDFGMRRSRAFNYKQLRLGRRDRLRFVSTKPSTSLQPRIRYSVFPVSPAYAPQDGTLPALLARISIGAVGNPDEQLTNALAVAGRLVVESQKRRAALVVTADCARVTGLYRADAVRKYLEELHVPLVVWQVTRVSPDQREKGLCETAEEIDTVKKYRAAVLRLRRTLERQQIVWVRGHLLPRQIVISTGVRGVSLAGQ